MTATQTTLSTTDLVRFILTRLDDEDSEIKRRVRQMRGGQQTDVEMRSVERLRAESLARRQVVGSAQQLLVLRDQPNEKAVRDVAAHILRAVATPYAEHTAFRPEWLAGGR